MPVFFLLSGYFYIPTIRRLAAPEFLRRNALRIIWPMVLWTYIFLLVKLVAGSLANAPLRVSDILVFPIPGYAHMWFLWALFIMTLLLFPLKLALRDGRISNGVLYAVGLATLVPWFVPFPKTVHEWSSSALMFIPYFYLGIVIAEKELLRRVTHKMALCFVALFILTLNFWPTLDQAGFSRVGSIILTICFVMAIACLLGPKSFLGKSWLLWFGQSSLVIYVAHTIFSAAFRAVTLTLGIESLWVHATLGTIVGIVGPLILLAGAKATRSRRLLGL